MIHQEGIVQLDRAFGTILNEERAVEARHWMHVPVAGRPGYTKLMREARILLTKDGFPHGPVNQTRRTQHDDRSLEHRGKIRAQAGGG